MSRRFVLFTLSVFAMAGSPIFAGAHTWDVNEVFSNADGTIQFVELREANGTPNETGVHNFNLWSTLETHAINVMIASPTTNKFLLFATPAFAALPGAPTPDELFLPGEVPFFSVTGDTIRYGAPYDTLTFGAVVPTDGIMSLNKNLTTGVNSPTNYAGQTGSVNANPPPAPPAVPDGSDGSIPMEVVPLDLAATSMSIDWDTSTCTGATEHQIIYGEGSQLPASPGGAFSVTGSVCVIGAPPFVWNPTPTAGDGSGLIWWLVVVVDTDSTTEGSWGLGSDGLERLGPGPSGSSGECGVTVKSLTNTCGN